MSPTVVAQQKLVMPPLESTISTHRVASNNSCTGGSSDAKNNNSSTNKTTINSTQRTTTTAQPYNTKTGINVHGSSKYAQISTGVRLNAILNSVATNPNPKGSGYK